MAINQDILIQYAKSINKNIGVVGTSSVNDNENAQEALQVTSNSLSGITTAASRIRSIIKNQILLDRFEYKEKARIQKEINAETNNRDISAVTVNDNNGDITPLAGVFSNMFESLTERVQLLAESASTACSGTGIGSSLRDVSSAPIAPSFSSATTLATGGAIAGGLGLAGAYNYANSDGIDTPDIPSFIPAAAAATPQPQPAAPKEAVKAPITTSPATAVKQAPKAAAPERAPKPPSIPASRKPPAAAALVARPAPFVSQQTPTRSFNWPSLFTSFAAPTAAAYPTTRTSATFQSLTQAQEKFLGYNPLADIGGAQGEKIPQGDTAGYLKTLYSAFKEKGLTHEGAITMLAQIGRENGYRANNLFGSHYDPKNNALNVGMISWQGDRALKLIKFLQARGAMKDNKIIPGDAALRAQVDFIMEELKTGTYSRSLAALRDPNLKYAQIEGIVGDNYIGWARNDPRYRIPGYNNQNLWMRRARALLDKPGQITRPMPQVPAAPTGYKSLSQAAADFYQETASKLTGVGKFIYPVASVRPTSGFGPRKGRMHQGLDFGARKPGVDGDPIHASAAGVVTYAGWDDGYGNFIKISHGNGIETRYAHLRGFAVGPGQTVAQGQQIGIMGNTGRSRGSHLHFEIRKDGQPINPAGLLGKSFPVRPDERATEPGAEEETPGKRMPGKPGWSLTPSRNDDPVTIQRSQIEKFKRDRARPSLILQSTGSESPGITMGIRNGGGRAAPNGRSRDIVADFKRGFGL